MADYSGGTCARWFYVFNGKKWEFCIVHFPDGQDVWLDVVVPKLTKDMNLDYWKVQGIKALHSCMPNGWLVMSAVIKDDYNSFILNHCGGFPEKEEEFIFDQLIGKLNLRERKVKIENDTRYSVSREQQKKFKEITGVEIPNGDPLPKETTPKDKKKQKKKRALVP